MAEELYPKKQGPQNPQVRQSSQEAVRIRILENRYKNLSRREQLAEDNMLRFEKELNGQVRAVKSKVTETRRHLEQINDRLDIVQGQMVDAASKYDLRVLEAYLNMIEPFEYATRAEMKRLLDDQQQ